MRPVSTEESGNGGSKLSRLLNHILISIYLSISIYIYIYIYKYIYIYISQCIHTHTHIYIYIHVNESVYIYQNLHLHKSLHDLTSSCSHILPQSLIQTRFSPSFQLELRPVAPWAPWWCLDTSSLWWSISWWSRRDRWVMPPLLMQAGSWGSWGSWIRCCAGNIWKYGNPANIWNIDGFEKKKLDVSKEFSDKNRHFLMSLFTKINCSIHLHPLALLHHHW